MIIEAYLKNEKKTVDVERIDCDKDGKVIFVWIVTGNYTQPLRFPAKNVTLKIKGLRQ